MPPSRSFKQTLGRQKMKSGAPAQAEWELTGVVIGIWVLGCMSVESIVAASGGQREWSVALARKQVRLYMRKQAAFCWTPLSQKLGGCRKDAYKRKGSKKAKDWPHKKREKPPGGSKEREATLMERQAAQRFQGCFTGV